MYSSVVRPSDGGYYYVSDSLESLQIYQKHIYSEVGTVPWGKVRIVTFHNVVVAPHIMHLLLSNKGSEGG